MGGLVDSVIKRLNIDVVATFTQQSRVESPASQLSVPHTKSPAQWLSRSQSPSPTPQGEASVQQAKLFVDGLHFFGIITVVDRKEDMVNVVDLVAGEEGELSVESDMKRLNGDVVITFTQQSSVESPAAQLSVPHTKSPAQ